MAMGDQSSGFKDLRPKWTHGTPNMHSAMPAMVLCRSQSQHKILAAELHAVIRVLRVGSTPIKIHVDNSTVVDGFATRKAFVSS